MSALALEQTDGVMLRWENHAKRRYYQARLQKNLFGDWEVARSWGGIGSRSGRARFDPVGNSGDGETVIIDLNARRLKRGYSLTAGAPR